MAWAKRWSEYPLKRVFALLWRVVDHGSRVAFLVSIGAVGAVVTIVSFFTDRDWRWYFLAISMALVAIGYWRTRVALAIARAATPDGLVAVSTQLDGFKRDVANDIEKRFNAIEEPPLNPQTAGVKSARDRRVEALRRKVGQINHADGFEGFVYSGLVALIHDEIREGERLKLALPPAGFGIAGFAFSSEPSTTDATVAVWEDRVESILYPWPRKVARFKLDPPRPSGIAALAASMMISNDPLRRRVEYRLETLEKIIQELEILK